LETLIILLLPAIIQVESRGDDAAVGDNGNAIGAYQIWKPYWQDGCEYIKKDYPYSNAYNRRIATEVVRGYLTRYGKHYERKTGKKATLEVLARIHNGGPNGWKKQATVKYWRKIQQALKEMK